MPRITAFRIALTTSVVIHGVILFVVIQQEYSITPEMTKVDETFLVSLSSTAPKAKQMEPVAESLPQLSQPPPTPEIADIEQPAPVNKEQEPVVPPIIKPVEVKEPRLNKSVSSMITAAVTQERNDAFDASLTPGCTLPERASEVRICEPDDSDVTGHGPATAFVGTFSNAFRPLSARGPSFNDDMAMVEGLMRRQEELASMNPAEGLEAAFVAQEHRDIAEQILRIDRRYQQVNLLRLIPIGVKVVTRLWEASKSKN